MTRTRPARTLAAAVLAATALAGTHASVAAGGGAANGTTSLFAITGGTVVVGDGRVLPGATVVVRDGVIEAVGKGVRIPAGAQTVEAKGRFVYPGLIDALAEQPAAPAKPDATPPRLLPLYAQVKAVDTPSGDEAAALWRDAGVLAANVAPSRGIFRGQSALVNLGGDPDHRVVKAPAVMNVSLQGLGYRNRVPGMGEPGGEFPTRLIGVFGFVRQTLLDARTLEDTVAAGGTVPAELDKADVRPSLEALRPVARREMPMILPAEEDREIRRALALADELGIDAVLAGAHDVGAMAATLKARNTPVLVSLNFPAPEKDVHPEFRVPLRVLHEWQQAPRSAAALGRAGVRMGFYSDGLASGAEYLAALRRVVREGLPRDAALRAATLGAAEILGASKQLGSIAPGKLANLVVTEGDLFDDTSRIRQVYVAGKAYEPAASATPPVPAAGMAAMPPVPDPFEGLVPDLGRVVLIKNANVMTVSHGTLKGASLLIRDGKIAALGTDVATPAGARVVDGTGKWITPGFIDCHSHIATDSHNESGSNITAMTGTPDTLNPHDIPIYRTLAAGVTTANVLHGSVNPIGGRTIVIKNRWGRTAPEMVFEGAKPGQKFAVKEFGPRRGISPPSSLMGDEALMRDAFTRARHYAQGWDDYKAQVAVGKTPKVAPRRDLVLEALAEILRGDRFLHVHTYTPEEMTVVLRVAQEFGFKVRTLQHATEGWKIAPEIKRLTSAGASIFADLGGANPYSASILTRAGVLVSVNSDGEDLARHFNHDVARLRKYGDLTEDETLALITLNPARQLAIEDRVGSIDVGKDADIVVFDKYPLSVYSVPETVFIDGKVYYSREAEKERERRVEAARRTLAAGAKEVSNAR